MRKLRLIINIRFSQARWLGDWTTQTQVTRLDDSLLIISHRLIWLHRRHHSRHQSPKSVTVLISSGGQSIEMCRARQLANSKFLMIPKLLNWIWTECSLSLSLELLLSVWCLRRWLVDPHCVTQHISISYLCLRFHSSSTLVSLSVAVTDLESPCPDALLCESSSHRLAPH